MSLLGVPVGAVPHWLRTASLRPPAFAPWALEPEAWPVLLGLVSSLPPVPEFEPVLAPEGLLAVGTTFGTPVHALSKASRFGLLWAGTWAAGTENSIHSILLLTMPKRKDWQEVLDSQLAWQPLAVVIPSGWDNGV